MIRYILLALTFYLAYKLVFDLVIPVFRTTRKVQQQFRSMHQQMQDPMNGQQQSFRPDGNPSGSKKSPPAGDYIDFEEVK
jgi:hypothetical protein